jgi:hypothetical protein
MVRLLLLLLGTFSARGPGQRETASYRRPGSAGREAGPLPEDPYATVRAHTRPAPRGPWSPWPPEPGRGGPPEPGGPGGYRTPPRRRPLRRWLTSGAVLLAAGLIFRRAIASVVLMTLSAGLHLVGINAQLPHVRFGWPWQAIGAGHTSTTELGPWVLQKIQGISRPALGQANFDFVFTHKVSKSFGPWPCWYASTFYAVGHASATVDLNPGPAWWAPAQGHYRLQVLSRPRHGKPGHVTVTMVLPPPQLPRSPHDVSIDNIPSKPVSTQHSWTYPGLGCGLVLRPQFPESVLYAQAQRIAFYKASHPSQVTRSLITTAENQAQQTIRGNFIQPTVNAFGYTLDRLTIQWAAG